MNQNIIKFRINKKNLNRNYFLFLLIPFFVSGYRTIELEAFNSKTIFISIFDFLSLPHDLFSVFLWNIFWKFFILVFIIFGISIFAFNVQKSLKRFPNEISIKRIKDSEGNKFADIWYFVCSLIANQFPLVIVFLTFGSSNLFGNLELSFHDF